MADTRADDTQQSILALLKLYALDTPNDPRGILNRVAWTLRENGWGLLGESDHHLANLITGRVYQVQVAPDGLALIPLGELNHSEFVDPVEPAALPVPPAPEPPAPPPPTMLSFLKTKAPDDGTDTSPVPPNDTTERLRVLDEKLDAIIGLFETLAQILDSFHDRQDRKYTGTMRLMDRSITLTPVDPK